jgi:hypothetical protein
MEVLDWMVDRDPLAHLVQMHYPVSCQQPMISVLIVRQRKRVHQDRLDLQVSVCNFTTE